MEKIYLIVKNNMLSCLCTHCSVHLFCEEYFFHIQRPLGLAISPNLLCCQGLEVCLYVCVLDNKAFPVNLPIAGFRIIYLAVPAYFFSIAFYCIWLAYPAKICSFSLASSTVQSKIFQFH